MVVSLYGFLDAGSASVLAADHLESLSDGKVVATFDVDQFHDYRARRPAMTFVRDHYSDYEAPRLVVRLQRDSAGQPFLLLRGPEPDNRWEAFCGAVRDVVERLGVTRVVDVGAVPMAVPHTRPIAITPHANRSDLLTGESPWRGELRIPSSAQALLQLRLGEWGHDALGFVAHVPHYLAQLEYPKAATALLEHVEIGGRLTVDLTALRAQAERREVEIAHYLDANEEVRDVVAGLEQQYDAFEAAEDSGAGLLASDQPLPTGDEIGQQFEQFLAGLDGPDPDPGVPGPTRLRARRTDRAGIAKELVDLLDLEQIDLNLFRGRQPDTDRQRVFGGQVAAQALIAAIRTIDEDYLAALDALLLPAAGRHLRPDRLRRRAAARRSLVRHPAGGGPPARPADLLPDRQLPARRGRLRAPGRDARGRSPGVGPRLHGAAAHPRQRRRRAARQGVGRARGALPRQLQDRPRRRTPSTRRGPGSGCGSATGSPTTPATTSRRSPTPAT